MTPDGHPPLIPKAEEIKLFKENTEKGMNEIASDSPTELIGRLKAKNAELVDKNTELRTKNDKLEKEAIVDKLTGLYNRRFFDRRMLETANEAIRHDRDFSLLFVDLDKFKKLNDELGHKAGDSALKYVSGIIRKIFRPSDVKCRYGGEELVIILPETEQNEAFIAAERLREAIEDELKPFLIRKYGKKAEDQFATTSIGVASRKGGKWNEAEPEAMATAIINAADTAMYHSKKEEGRNFTTIFPPINMGENEKGEQVSENNKNIKQVEILSQLFNKNINENTRQLVEKLINENND